MYLSVCLSVSFIKSASIFPLGIENALGSHGSPFLWCPPHAASPVEVRQLLFTLLLPLFISPLSLASLASISLSLEQREALSLASLPFLLLLLPPFLWHWNREKRFLSLPSLHLWTSLFPCFSCLLLFLPLHSSLASLFLCHWSREKRLLNDTNSFFLRYSVNGEGLPLFEILSESKCNKDTSFPIYTHTPFFPYLHTPFSPIYTHPSFPIYTHPSFPIYTHTHLLLPHTVFEVLSECQMIWMLLSMSVGWTLGSATAHPIRDKTQLATITTVAVLHVSPRPSSMVIGILRL